MERFRSGDETLFSPGAAGPQRCPEGQLSPRAGSMSPSQPASGVGGSTPCGAVSTREISVFVPGLLEL